MRSTLCLRSVIFISYVIKGAFEGAVDFLTEMADDPNNLSALNFSSMVHLDIVCYGILKALKGMLSNNAHSKLLSSTLLTPLMGASVSFACHLGLYTKAQLRLEDQLQTSDKGVVAASFFTYSELLWSQLVHLQSSLPFSEILLTTPIPSMQFAQTFSQVSFSGNHKKVARCDQ